jgi:hypothetical protein
MGDVVGGDSAVLLTDGRVSLRPSSQQDAQFMVDANADPAI